MEKESLEREEFESIVKIKKEDVIKKKIYNVKYE